MLETFGNSECRADGVRHLGNSECRADGVRHLGNSECRADGVRHLESPAKYNLSSLKCKWLSYPWRNLRQVRRCLRFCYAIAGGYTT